MGEKSVRFTCRRVESPALGPWRSFCFPFLFIMQLRHLPAKEPYDVPQATLRVRWNVKSNKAYCVYFVRQQCCAGEFCRAGSLRL